MEKFEFFMVKKGHFQPLMGLLRRVSKSIETHNLWAFIGLT